MVPVTEEFTFFIQVNDGARLWVNGQLLIDRFEEPVDESESSGFETFASIPFVEYSNGTAEPLDTGVMHDIVLEYRENTGGAVVRLLYSSPTISKQVIPMERLYHSTEPILGSPFTVEPEGVVPFSPEEVRVTVESESSLLVRWSPPSDAGGADIAEYRIDWWNSTSGAGSPEK